MPLEDASAAAAVLARTSVVLDALPRGIIVWDVDATVLAWNHEAERIFGWSATEVLGRHLGDLIVLPADLEDAYMIALSVEAGEPWQGEITLRRRTGEPLRLSASLRPLFDDDGNIVGTVGSADDVTHQRVVEERAAELTNHLLMALAGGELGTWRWEIASGRVAWDSTMERLFGLDAGTFAGTFESWVAMVHPDDRDEVLAVLERAVEEVSSYQVEHRVIWPDGSVHWLQGRAMVTLGPDGLVSGSIGCTGDVTGRKVAELEIERRAREAEALLEAGRLQRKRLEFLAAINEAALSAANHRELMGDVTRTAVPTLGDWCALHFISGSGTVAMASPEIVVAHYDPNRIARIHDLLIKHPYNPQAPIGAAYAIREGETQFIADFGPIREHLIANAVRANPDEARAILDELMPTSLIAVPLITKRGVIGSMQFVSAESGRLYDADDVALAETAAGRVAEALDNAWQRDQQRNVAAVLQNALLPPSLPAIDGVSVAVRYWASGEASDVGGDFYDLFRLPDADSGAERWAVVIGDVCGTGPEAAAVTALARHTIRAAAKHGADPTEVLEWLNDAILDGERDRFCTVLYSVIERIDEGRWRFTSVAGGHPLPLVIRPGEDAAAAGRPGTLLGVMPKLRLSPSEIELRTGDTILMHTDGITDVPAPYGLDDAQLRAMVTAASGAAGAAERVAERLGEAVQRVLPLNQRDDDIALVVFRIVERSDAAEGIDDDEVIAEQAFGAEPAAVALAREFAVSAVADPAMEDSLRLAVSELATNAVIHANSPFRVRLSRHGHNVRVEVADDNPAMPVRQNWSPDAAGGRGISIVEHLALAWGVTPRDGGKAVWFELSSTGRR